MGKIIAILDEFGTNSINIEAKDVSTHFLLSAILVKEESVEKIRNEVEKIGKKYFQGSEIKSSKVKKKQVDRRLLILQEISTLDFSIFTLIVDKREISTKGLTIKQSFYKYFHKVIVHYLNRIDKRIVFLSDKIGDESFQKSLTLYINRNVIQIDLFNPDKIYEFSDSKEDFLIQLSDFVVGSLAKVFDLKQYNKSADDILRLLESRLHLRFWPEKIENYLVDTNYSEQYDNRIASLSLNLAHDYIIKHENSSDETIIYRVAILRYLILFQRIAPLHFIQTYQLIERLKSEFEKDYSERAFRKNIIGALRDEHIIISSSNSGGYKLPVSKNDLIEFVNRYNGIIQPMIGRMKKCRESVMIKTLGELDILGYSEYENLKKMVEIIN